MGLQCNYNKDRWPLEPLGTGEQIGYKYLSVKNEKGKRPMSPTTITLLFLAFAIISFILEKIPLALTATIVALGLNLTGVLDTSQTFAGYINSNVILCVGMFVVGQALFETGMANKIGSLVTKFAKSERILIIMPIYVNIRCLAPQAVDGGMLGE